MLQKEVDESADEALVALRENFQRLGRYRIKTNLDSVHTFRGDLSWIV